MVVSAAFYLATNAGGAEELTGGWGILTATRVPKRVVAFIVGVAIIDDIGAAPAGEAARCNAGTR